MGTNFFFHTEPCHCCGLAPEPLHICKSYRGFAAVTEWDETGDVKNVVIGSWAQWKHRILTTPHTYIADEYGTRHDAAVFIAAVEGVSPEFRLDYHTRQMAAWVDFQMPLDEVWVDDEGYHFTSREFS